MQILWSAWSFLCPLLSFQGQKGLSTGNSYKKKPPPNSNDRNREESPNSMKKSPIRSLGSVSTLMPSSPSCLSASIYLTLPDGRSTSHPLVMWTLERDHLHFAYLHFGLCLCQIFHRFCQPLIPLRTSISRSSVGLMGVFPISVKIKDCVATDILHIMESPNAEVLGRNFLFPLRVFDLLQPLGIKQCNSATPQLESHPNLLSSSLGTFKDQTHHIHLKPGTTPVAVNPRPIPLHMRDATIKEVKLMDELGIWEHVLTLSGHTRWL